MSVTALEIASVPGGPARNPLAEPFFSPTWPRTLNLNLNDPGIALSQPRGTFKVNTHDFHAAPSSRKHKSSTRVNRDGFSVIGNAGFKLSL